MSILHPLWGEVPFDLKYRFGELTLLSRRFRALTLRNHFLSLPADPNQPPPPLARLGRDVDVIVTRSHPLRETLPRMTVLDGAIRYAIKHYARYYTTLSGTLDEYLAKFSAKTRNTLRRKVRRVLERGSGSEMREYKARDDMEEFCRLARTVSAKSYQERLLDAGLPDGPEFVRELRELADRNAVRGYILFLQHEPVAYLCCPATDGILLYSYLGYNPEHADLSPGTVLQYLVLERLFNEQVFRAFDFSEGQGAHKGFFATQEVLCADICYFSPSVSVRAWLRAHIACDVMSTAVGRGLETLRLKATVRRFLRRRG